MSVKKDFVYFFVHVPKTAGTTLVKNITRNLSKGEFLELSPKSLGLRPDLSMEKYKKAAEEFVSKQKSLKKVKFVYGHTVPYGIHKYFDKNPRYITIIRHPVRRIPSIYNYFYTLISKNPNKRIQKRMANVFLANGEKPNFKTWYLNKFAKDDQDMALINSYQFLARLGYVRKTSKTTKELKSDLKKFYFIGITKNFKSDSLFIYNLLGVNKYFFSENVSDKKVQIGENSVLGKKIKSDNSVSGRIFNAALSLNQRFISDNSDYQRIVKKEALKRAILMPLTQLIFEPGLIWQKLRSKLNSK